MKGGGLITLAVGVALVVVAYSLINKKDKETTSSFSNACGCGK